MMRSHTFISIYPPTDLCIYRSMYLYIYLSIFYLSIYLLRSLAYAHKLSFSLIVAHVLQEQLFSVYAAPDFNLGEAYAKVAHCFTKCTCNLVCAGAPHNRARYGVFACVASSLLTVRHFAEFDLLRSSCCNHQASAPSCAGHFNTPLRCISLWSLCCHSSPICAFMFAFLPLPLVCCC